MNTDAYDIKSVNGFYGFLAGVCAGNYDVTHIFVDATLKIIGRAGVGVDNIAKSNMNEFKSGYFDIQDQGSQLVCDRIKLEPKARVLDYCAGSGGKTLNLASKYYSKEVSFFCYDIRSFVLEELLIRSKRLKVDGPIKICNKWIYNFCWKE